MKQGYVIGIHRPFNMPLKSLVWVCRFSKDYIEKRFLCVECLEDDTSCQYTVKYTLITNPKIKREGSDFSSYL